MILSKINKLMVYSIFVIGNTYAADNALTTIKTHPLELAAAVGISAALATYFWYGTCLDTRVNNKNSLWHWSMHHIRNGFIDQSELLTHIQERYSELQTLHPLASIFAACHEVQIEIDTCLDLLGFLKTLKRFGLDWVMNETIIGLDRKLESLYTLKIMLSQCSIETRTRCRKQAQLS